MSQQRQPGSKKDKKRYQKYHKPCSRGIGHGSAKHRHCVNFDHSQRSLGYGSRFFGICIAVQKELWEDEADDEYEEMLDA